MFLRQSIVFMISACVLLASQVMAHGRYILPSHTVLSGDKTEVSGLMASITNGVFHADKPFGDNGSGQVPDSLKGFFKTLNYQLHSPSGQVSEFDQWQALQRFSVADLVLKESGTYRVSTVQSPTLMTVFVNAEGKQDRRFGPQPLPVGAKDIKRILVESRVEAFVTLNDLSTEALRPTGVGLELSGDHPNDVFVGEAVSFQLLLKGRPLNTSAEVSITHNGTRHRNSREPISLETNKTGAFSVTFDKPGFYLLEADINMPSTKDNIDIMHYGLYVTLEVFPQ